MKNCYFLAVKYGGSEEPKSGLLRGQSASHLISRLPTQDISARYWERRVLRCSLPDQHRQAGKYEVSGSIVNHIDLAIIETWLQLRQGNIELKHCRFAAGNSELLYVH